MKAINDFLLNLFTGNDELRKNLMFPNLKDGIVYATDAHVLIAIPQEELELTYNTREKFPNANKVFLDIENSKQKQSVKIKVSDLAMELTKARIETDKHFVKCEECNTDGEVEWVYCDKTGENHYKDFECPVCNGDRKVEERNPYPRINITNTDDYGFDVVIKIGDLNFYPFQLFRIFMVALSKGETEIEFLYTGDASGCFIRIDKIRMVIAPSIKVR